MIKKLQELKVKFYALCTDAKVILSILLDRKVDIDDNRKAIDRIHNLLLENRKQTAEVPLLVVARHNLGSIDVSDAEDPDAVQSDELYSEYLARAFQMYPTIEKEAKFLMKLQHDFWFTQANGEQQMMFGRGTYNGIDLFLERFKLLRDKHIERTKKPEEEPQGSTEDILARLRETRSVTPDAPVEEDK